jgi:hypothetical protein
VEVEQELVPGQEWWKLPFAESCGELSVQASAGIAKGRAGGVVQSDTDTAVEETLVGVKSGLETACRFGLDALFPQEVGVGL